MVIKINKEIDKQKWEEAIKHSPFASPFQTFEYFKFINAVPSHGALAVAIEDKGKYRALAVISLLKENGIKSYFSRRGIIYGGPLLDANYPDAMRTLMEKLDQICKYEVIYLETRNLFSYEEQKDFYSQQGWKYIPYQNYHLVLAGQNIESILKGMDYNRRREIKLSLQEGAYYIECQNEHDLKALYSILVELYKERVKLPIPSFNFFQGFFRSEIGKVFIVKHNNIVIGGSFCPIIANRTIYSFYYCGIRNYHKKIFPTHLAVMAAIEYGVNNNIALFDFMGAGKPGLEYGVRKYKKEFGGELVEYGRFLRVIKPCLYSIGKGAVKLLARINH